MDNKKVGKYLKELRENSNLTQEDVAGKLNVGRDAIIRIEKGERKINSNEIGMLSNLYNISSEDILNAGKKKDINMKGIILAGGSGTRLYPITEATSKQLIPVYDKPMIYYPLTVLMQAGIKDILVITTKDDQENFKRLLKDGSQFGTNISYVIQPSPDGLAQAFILGNDFIGKDPCAMVLGDNLFFGDHLPEKLRKAKENASNGYATIFGFQVKDPERFGIMELDKNNNVIGVEEKPLEPKSDYAITGLYFYPSGVQKHAYGVKPSKRGELEITTLNDMYLKENKLKACLLGRGYTWFDTGTFDSLYDASNLIKAVQNNQDYLIGSPDLTAFENGWISEEELLKRANLMKKNSYGQYLMKTYEEKQKTLGLRK